MNYILLAPGFEEIEAMATVDVLRRAGMTVTEVAVAPSTEVVGAHGQKVLADLTIDQADFADADWLILPGGMPGASNLYECAAVRQAIEAHWAGGGHLAAICAAPAVVLAPLGVLEGLAATCYPGFEDALGASHCGDPVVASGRVVTAQGPGFSMAFGLKIVEQALGADAAKAVAAGMLLS